MKTRITVKNRYGVELDFDKAANLMDDYIREETHRVVVEENNDSFQHFFDVYCQLHSMACIGQFQLDRKNPCW